MTDTVSKKKRSSIMSKIKGKKTRIEKSFVKILNNNKIKHRANVKNLFGKPDIAISSKKIVIFLDSCFWHGCKKHCRMPAQNRDYWINKISRNKKRDKEVLKHYKEKGWKIIRIWEHDLGNYQKVNRIIQDI